MDVEHERLGPRQRDLLAAWVPDARVVTDHSWGLVATVVLELESEQQGRLVVKAGGATDTHIVRELRAHREWLGPWVLSGHTPELVHADRGERLLVTRYLPGRLVEGTPAQDDPETYRQAGALLATLHGQLTGHDPSWNERVRARVLHHLEQPHRISPDVVRRVHEEVTGWPVDGADVVPTHGDWQPRNWLDDDGTVRVIDLGRADLRPASTDLVRIARQDFVRDARLETAFLDGYGRDPREPASWRRELVAEAVGTAVWAHGVGDEDFEQLGHRQLGALFR